MSDIIKSIFRYKKMNIEKIINYGFKRLSEQAETAGNAGKGKAEEYVFSRAFAESGFIMTVSVNAEGTVSAWVIDPSFDAPYTLHLTGGAAGTFVGEVRREYIETLSDIADKCFEPDVFKCPQTLAVIEYASRKYGTEAEFLWEKMPDNAVLRRTDSKKWYAALLTVKRNKLPASPAGSSGSDNSVDVSSGNTRHTGVTSDNQSSVEIIDLRSEPAELESRLDYKSYFPGYHMNKKHWYTVILDGSVSNEDLFLQIDASYELADARKPAKKTSSKSKSVKTLIL